MTDETTLDTQTIIRCAAFEAAYLDMTPPDPASHRFAVLVGQSNEPSGRWRGSVGVGHLVASPCVVLTATNASHRTPDAGPSRSLR